MIVSLYVDGKKVKIEGLEDIFTELESIFVDEDDCDCEDYCDCDDCDCDDFVDLEDEDDGIENAVLLGEKIREYTDKILEVDGCAECTFDTLLELWESAYEQGREDLKLEIDELL